MVARAHSIDSCLQQLYRERTGRECTIQAIRNALIDSVQGKDCKKLWPAYKRVCKKSPLSMDLLNKTYALLEFKLDVANLQRQFEFY